MAQAKVEQRSSESRSRKAPPPSRTPGNGHAESDPILSPLLQAMQAMRMGDFSVRLPTDQVGIAGKIADAFNEVIEVNERMSAELERLGRVVGKEGKISQRASIGEVSGAWQDSIESVNALISDLVHPVSETARVIGAVAKPRSRMATVMPRARSTSRVLTP